MPFRPKWVDCAWYHPHMGILLCIVKNILWKREKSWIYQCHTQMREVNLTSFLLSKKETDSFPLDLPSHSEVGKYNLTPID